MKKDISISWKYCIYLVIFFFLVGLVFQTQNARAESSIRFVAFQADPSYQINRAATATPPAITNTGGTPPIPAIPSQRNPGLIAGGVIILAVIAFGFIRSLRKG